MEHNEESEFDKDDEHEHTAECGHTPEEHARMERLQKNFRKFLADNADDMLDPETYIKLKNKIEKRLKQAGITPSLTTLKVFREGYEFGLISHINMHNEVGRIFSGINKMVTEREPKKPKVAIDITKSLPLPPGKEDGAE